MKIVNAADIAGSKGPGSELKVLLAGAADRLQHGMMGVFRVDPGVRYPAADGEYSCHPVEEFSYVVSGRVRVWVEGQEADLTSGAAMVIYPGERHYICNAGDSPAEVVWVLAPPMEL